MGNHFCFISSISEIYRKISRLSRLNRDKFYLSNALHATVLMTDSTCNLNAYSLAIRYFSFIYRQKVNFLLRFWTLLGLDTKQRAYYERYLHHNILTHSRHIQIVPLATEPGNEDIATKFEQEYFRCVRNEEECVCSVSVVRLIVATRSSNILISGKIIKEMPGSVASGTHCTKLFVPSLEYSLSL